MGSVHTFLMSLVISRIWNGCTYCAEDGPVSLTTRHQIKTRAGTWISYMQKFADNLKQFLMAN